MQDLYFQEKAEDSLFTISKIRKANYTHLIDSFSLRKKSNEVEVGWGKYYGPMLEHGTVKMNAQPHLNPVWDRNKEKYYKKMITLLSLPKQKTQQILRWVFKTIITKYYFNS